MNEPRDYSLKEAARILGLHENTVWRFVKTKKIRAHRAGRAWRINALSLREFRDANSNQRDDA